MTKTQGAEIYYDPYDLTIDADPYPVWRRLRDSAPLYYNEKYDFYALSRFDDVERALTDWGTYISGEGFVLEIIKAGVRLPPGNLLAEDPPVHDIHRGLLSRVFTPRKMAALEPQVRALCARLLDELSGAESFDFVADFGAIVPMRVIGMMLGIPEGDQEAIRDAGTRRHQLTEGEAPPPTDAHSTAQPFAEYIDWRATHPSDDLMTELITTEFTDETGTTRRLTREEVLTYTSVLAGAGNETTRRLIGWTGQLLGEHPDQRRELAADRSAVPQAIEEILRFESPSPVQGRVVSRDVEHHGGTIPAGSAVLLLNSSANRDERHFTDPDTFDIHRRIDRHLAFGHGLHFCLGASLARMEGRVVLDEVLKRWTDWEVDRDNAVLDHTSTTRGWTNLPVIIS
ncbi:cytochrome [Parafrankia colletiae]|uniref:Cytochrome n=1 Tax=Parafrankia colletiae TaxID=573497 RepID=A0A1S1Q8E9_9ACTN|nr:cytochrome P450 [Parafrankia colletiae]MCK9904285.1 cytochrome P450 [Frankia sp. Cpl3]OHV28484.1 cytochrome [Parafrankia colletiae]